LKKKATSRQSRRDPDAHMRAPSPLLLAMEGRAFLEWAACIAAWPLLTRAARGDGHPVLVLPGLTAGDASTWPLRKFIERCGYPVYPWELGLNFGPRDGVVRKLTARVREIEREHQRKVSLVGWSLGGAMARVLAAREPKRVRSVITLGSPLGGHPKATNAWRLFELVSGVSADDPRLRALMSRHPPVPSTSILSKTDGIVSWPMSLIPQTAQSENIEVSASHFGMGANPTVLWAVADRLSQAEGKWKPFDRRGLRSLVYDDPHDGLGLSAAI
jgi:pimeloyl-ACP methyl ester carboxylesterase